MIVKEKDTVKVHYTGKFENGDVFDSSLGKEPLIFQMGAGMMIPGFEKEVLGMKIGDKKNFKVIPSEGFGEYQEKGVVEVGKEKLPKEIDPEPGMVMEVSVQDNQKVNMVIKEVKEKTIVLDGNHPLAGQTIFFDIELLEIGCEMPEVPFYEGD